KERAEMRGDSRPRRHLVGDSDPPPDLAQSLRRRGPAPLTAGRPATETARDLTLWARARSWVRARCDWIVPLLAPSRFKLSLAGRHLASLDTRAAERGPLPSTRRSAA